MKAGRTLSISGRGILGLVCCLVGLWAVLPVQAQPLVSEPRPVLLLDRPDHDFGIVRQGQRVETTVTLQNTGNTPLRIRRITATCGAAAHIPGSYELAPGDWRVVTVTLDTRDRIGATDNLIRFHSNDPAQPVVKLLLKADIRIFLDVRPSRLDMTGVFPGESRTENVRIHNTSRRPIRLIDVDSSRPEITASLSHRVLPPGQVASLRVRVEVPKQAGSRFTGRLRIRTDHPDYRVLTLPVRVVVMGGKTPLPKVKTRLPVVPHRERPAPKTPKAE